MFFEFSCPWTIVTDAINDLLDTFPNTVHIMLNIEPQIEKKSFTYIQGNTINEMVQTNSHRFNTHVNHLSLSASMVIIIITRLLQLLKSSHNISIIYCYTILPPVYSKLMSHYQLSNVAIQGLGHSETDMNS